MNHGTKRGTSNERKRFLRNRISDWRERTSTVGFPRESRISRAKTDLMEDMLSAEVVVEETPAVFGIPVKAVTEDPKSR